MCDKICARETRKTIRRPTPRCCPDRPPLVCVGADRAEGLRHPLRFMQFIFARWTIDADPVWEPFQPDPAQRPPDATSDA